MKVIQIIGAFNRSLTKQLQELSESNTEDRAIICKYTGNIQDIKQNKDLLWQMIDLHMDKDLRHKAFLSQAFDDLDTTYNRNLSKGRTKAQLRRWASGEAEKLVSIWRYFVRLCKRSDWAKDTDVIRLKCHYFDRPSTVLAPSDSEGDGSQPRANSAESLLHMLPPCPTDDSTDEDNNEASSPPQGADQLPQSGKRILRRNPGDVSHVTVDSSIADPLAEFSGADDEGGSPADTTVHKAVVRAKKTKKNIQKKPATAVSGVLKHPAAKHGRDAQTAGWALMGGSQQLKAATRKRPAAASGGGGTNDVSGHLDMDTMLKAAGDACIDASAGPRPMPNIRASYQRGTWHYQIVDVVTSERKCQVTDKQFRSCQAAQRAAEVLAKMYQLGCSKADMQRIKLSGCLGVSCGNQPHT